MTNNENIKKPLKDWLDDFHEDTGKISDLTRNLAFAGIGIIWIFRISDAASQHLLPTELILPLKFLVCGLLTDVLQYLWRAINIYIFYSIKSHFYDKGKLTDADIEDVKFPTYIPFVTWIFFILKILFVGLAYYEVYTFLTIRI